MTTNAPVAPRPLEQRRSSGGAAEEPRRALPVSPQSSSVLNCCRKRVQAYSMGASMPAQRRIRQWRQDSGARTSAASPGITFRFPPLSETED